MAGSRAEDPNKGRFSKDNQPMKNGVSNVKNAVSRSISEELLENKNKNARKNKYVKEDILEYIGDSILKEDPKSKKSWIKEFIDDTLKIARKDSKSNQANKFLNILFREDLLDQLATLYNKQQRDDAQFDIYKVRSQLYDLQQAVFDDLSDKKILVINSRRSGKTFMLGRIIVRELRSNPDAHVVYINRTTSAAIRQIKKPFEEALAETNLRVIKGSIESKELHFSNGAQLLIVSNHNSADIDKLRGERISLCLLDECGHQRNMKQLVREVINPALMDYGEKAEMIMVGTPPRIPHTYIEECYNNPSWKKFHWTFMENPHIPNKENVIKEVCEEAGVTEDSAFIQREYFGRMDAYDDDAKWIKRYTQAEANKDQTWSHAFVGVDWGFEDKAAVVSVVADKYRKEAVVVADWSEAKKGIVEISERVKQAVAELKQEYNITGRIRVICDSNEKSAVYDLSKVYKIPNVEIAYKYNKDIAMDELSDYLSSGRITLSKNAKSTKEDCQNSLWKRDEETDRILHEIDDDIWHPNALMALLYINRQMDNDVFARPARYPEEVTNRYLSHMIDKGKEQEEQWVRANRSKNVPYKGYITNLELEEDLDVYADEFNEGGLPLPRTEDKFNHDE